MSTERVDHVAAALARLPVQFRDLPGWEAAITALVTPLQETEDTLLALLAALDIDAATGFVLDLIGRLVKQPRNGVTDDDLYRRYVKARIATNNSGGTRHDNITVARLILGDPAVRVHILEYSPAALIVELEDAPVDADVAEIVAAFIHGRSRGSASVAVGTNVVYFEDPAADIFRFADPCTYLNGAHAAGAATFTVDSTDGYPNVGGFVASWGSAVEELLTYTGKTATTFTGVDNPFVGGSGTTQNHPDNAAVQLFDLATTVHPGFALATFTDGAHLAGVTTFAVDDTTDYPSAGRFRVDVGTATEEELSYTGITATEFTGVQSVSPGPPGTGTIYAHVDRGAVVCPVPGTDPVNQPYSGGKFASAI